MCDYCEKRKVLGYDGAGDGISIDRDENRNLAMIESDSWEFAIDYCPMCGSKLNNKPSVQT